MGQLRFMCANATKKVFQTLSEDKVDIFCQSNQMTLCSCHPHEGSHLSPCDPAGCRHLLWQPGTVASHILVVMHT